MGIKGLGVAPLTGGTQRPLLQCIAMKLHSGIARHCTGLEGEAGCSSLVPAVPPIVPAPPQPHQLILERSLVCPTPSIFPSPYRNSTPLLFPTQKLQARARALNSKYIQCQAEPTQLPSLHPSGAVAERSN